MPSDDASYEIQLGDSDDDTSNHSYDPAKYSSSSHQHTSQLVEVRPTPSPAPPQHHQLITTSTSSSIVTNRPTAPPAPLQHHRLITTSTPSSIIPNHPTAPPQHNQPPTTSASPSTVAARPLSISAPPLTATAPPPIALSATPTLSNINSDPVQQPPPVKPIQANHSDAARYVPRPFDDDDEDDADDIFGPDSSSHSQSSGTSQSSNSTNSSSASDSSHSSQSSASGSQNSKSTTNALSMSLTPPGHHQHHQFNPIPVRETLAYPVTSHSQPTFYPSLPHQQQSLMAHQPSMLDYRSAVVAPTLYPSSDGFSTPIKTTAPHTNTHLDTTDCSSMSWREAITRYTTLDPTDERTTALFRLGTMLPATQPRETRLAMIKDIPGHDGSTSFLDSIASLQATFTWNACSCASSIRHVVSGGFITSPQHKLILNQYSRDITKPHFRAFSSNITVPELYAAWIMIVYDLNCALSSGTKSGEVELQAKLEKQTLQISDAGLFDFRSTIAESFGHIQNSSCSSDTPYAEMQNRVYSNLQSIIYRSSVTMFEDFPNYYSHSLISIL